MNNDFHTKYRPDSFDQVLGNEITVKALVAFTEANNFPHALLFSGIPGSGKTSIARIIAKELHCDPQNILEIDAATHTGVDKMRELMEGLRYKGFSANSTKIVILDECQKLSSSSWTSLLKIVEEPPEHLYFCFCTTDPHKIPKAIVSRCNVFNLKDVEQDDLTMLLEYVAGEENLELPKGALANIAQEAYGSPRTALTLLSKCRSCTTMEELFAALEAPGEDGDIIEFCRFLMKATNPSWKIIVRHLKPLKDMENESIRLTVIAYFSKVLIGDRVTEENLGRGLIILDAFTGFFNSSEKMSPVILATAKVFLGDEE